ncbi:MAG TPA: TIM-barrel domain-containing protein [Chloroflexia bacterium]|nr:TIM-barrel domain-containing protein [Chloroflexia bacterium]
MEQPPSPPPSAPADGTPEAAAWAPARGAWPPTAPGGQAFGPPARAAWDAAAGRLTAQSPDGATLHVQPLGADTVRVTLLAPGTAAAPPSFAVVGAAAGAGAGDVTETAAGWTVPTPAGPLTLGANGHLCWTAPSGVVRFATAPGPGQHAGFGWGDGWVWAWLEQNPTAAYFGAGERTGPLDRSTTQMTFWTADVGPHHPGTDAMYQCIPVFLAWDPTTGQTAGLFCDHPGLQRWDIGGVQAGALCVAARAPVLDLYLFAGPAMPDVLAQYTALTGRMPLPPRWALGFQQSRWSYYPASTVLAIAQEFRRRNLPGDVLYLDIDYMRGFRDFTFDPEGFPDPAGLLQALAALGFRVVTILDPGVKKDRGYRIYDEMFREQYYVKWPDGRPFVGTVWPGPCVFPDFFAPAVRAWWGRQHAALLDVGVAGIWDDMNEPAVASSQQPADITLDHTWAAGTFPAELVHATESGPRAHSAVHSAYGLQMARATAAALDALRPEARRFVLTRAGYAGVQRYAAVWTGDNHSWWEHLAMAVTMCQGMGLSGVPFVGTDIGGFNGRASGELYLRWLQFGAVMPLARAHYNGHESGGQDQEPWSFGPAIEAHARTALELRYRLLPYLYSLFATASETGAPVLRPLAWEFPRDPRGRTADTEALCGPALLVAPVTRAGQGAQAVYLPAGRWLHFATGVLYPGGQDVLVPTPLEHFPLFVRGGSIVPLGEPALTADAAAATAVTLLAVAPAPGDPPQAAFSWYEDDGATLAYRTGAWRRTPLHCAAAPDGQLRITIGPVAGPWTPPPRDLRLALAGLDRAPTVVLQDGHIATRTWDPAGPRLLLTLPPLAEGSTIQIEIEP